MESSISVSIPSTQRHGWLSDFIKRLFDIVVSSMVLFLFSPLYALIAIAIKRETPGPAFYSGLRVGRGRKYFKILKFRTMYETPESYKGPKVTAQDDARITPLGHWLRDTKLNEFPQFWNVLKGDMSLVGPRPEDPFLARTWPRETAEEIFIVRPGITSPASVLYRNEEEMLFARDVLQKYLHDLTPDKMRLDQLYVRYRSFWLDLDIILWTALLLVPKIRAYSPPEQLLYVGPITRLFQRYMRWFLWDFLVAFVSISFSGMLLRWFGPLNLGYLRSLQMAVGFSVLYSLVSWGFGVNRINWSKATTWNAVRLIAGWSVSTGIALGIHYYLGYTDLLHIGVILTASIISLCGFLVIRYRILLIIGLLSRVVHSRINTQLVRERMLVVGSGRTAEHLAWLLDHPTYSKRFQIAGFVDDDLFSQGLSIYGTKVLGSCQDVPALIEKYDIGIVLLADSRISIEEFKSLREISTKTATKFVVIPDVFGALKNLIVVPPFYNNDAEEGKDKTSPCNYCIGRYSRLEIECQIEELDNQKKQGLENV